MERRASYNLCVILCSLVGTAVMPVVRRAGSGSVLSAVCNERRVLHTSAACWSIVPPPLQIPLSASLLYRADTITNISRHTTPYCSPQLWGTKW